MRYTLVSLGALRYACHAIISCRESECRLWDRSTHDVMILDITILDVTVLDARTTKALEILLGTEAAARLAPCYQ